jgi:Arrestin (or S-antigen), N-terminal domain
MSVALAIELDTASANGRGPDHRDHYAPGEPISGHVLAIAGEPTNCRRLTVEIGWHTEGRGDKDAETHFETTLHEGPIEPGEQRFPFAATLPEGPLSYAGHYVNIVWQVNARLDLAWRFDPKAERTFYLALS